MLILNKIRVNRFYIDLSIDLKTQLSLKTEKSKPIKIRNRDIKSMICSSQDKESEGAPPVSLFTNCLAV